MNVLSLRCFISLWAACLLTLTAVGGNEARVKTENATVQLVSASETIVPGTILELAFRFDLEDHWHIYWENPGASGLPMEVVWQLPAGFEIGAIQWPAPKRIELAGMVSYGFEDSATMIVPVQVPADLRVGEDVEIKAEAFWLICKELCLPEEGNFALSLPVAESSVPSPFVNWFDEARSRQPLEQNDWMMEASIQGKDLNIQIEGDLAREIPEELYFYASASGLIDPSALQSLVFLGPNQALLKATVVEDFSSDTILAEIKGVLQSPDKSWAVAIAVVTGFSQMGNDPVENGDAISSSGGGLEQALLDLGLPGWLVLAFLGGLILNVMPCVLPVLSLKVMSLLKHSGQSRGETLAHGVAYTIGVVASFLVLAAVLFALRSLGDRVGWGFQLQNPGFVVVLTLLFFVFGLNLMGVFELGTSLIGADSKLSQRKGFLGSFGTGILAAVVGAPCVGPFIGGVSGLAVQVDVFSGLLIFGMMGLGMAIPFLVLAIFPRFMKFLPKPGPWMETLKQIMGFLLMAAVVFLVWVVGTSGGVSAVVVLLIAILLAAVASWIWGRWGMIGRSPKSRKRAFASALLMLGVALIWGGGGVARAYDSFDPTSGSSSSSVQWQMWSKEGVAEELAAGSPVFVDFTATWCLICQVNKKAALRTDATAELFAQSNIEPMVADWTRYDAA